MILMRKSLLLVLLVLGCLSAKAQNLLTEGFESTSAWPPSGWTNTAVVTTSGASYGYAWNQGPPSSYPSPSAHSGNKFAFYDSYNVSSGGIGQLVTPSLNFSSTGSKILSFWVYNYYSGFYQDKLEVYLNTSASVTGATLITTLYPTYIPSSTGWTQYTYTLPSTYTGTTNYIIFRATSDWGYDIYLDDVSVDNLVPCSGTISGGTASASANPVCANVSFTLTDVSYTVGSGMSYQWQSSPAGANTWTNITGATLPTYTVSAGISSATDYRFVATCNTVATAGISNTLAVALNTPTNCYCAQAASNTADDDIGQVVVGSFSYPTTAPTSLTSNSASNGTYTNNTGVGTIKIFAGQPTTFQVTQINSSVFYYPCYLKAFIDINANGSWLDAGETVFSQAGPGSASTTPPTPPTFSGTFTIPASTPGVITRMRLSLQESGSSTSVQPCNSYTWGETEDYTVKILPATPNPPTVTNNSPTCPTGTVTITAVDPDGYPSPTFTLTGPGISGSMTSTTGVFTLSNVTPAYGGVWSVTLSSGGFTSNPGTTTVVIYPTANLVVGTTTGTSTCTAADGSIQLTGLVANAQYTLAYVKPNGSPLTPSPTITASSTGTYTITGLIAGTYTNIKVTNVGSGGCASNTVSATVLPPSAPPAPVVTYQQPLCPNSTLRLNVTNANPNGTYQWTTTAPGVWNNPTPGTGPTASRNNMTSAQNGDYCAIVTVNGCVSAPGCVTVTVSSKDAKPTGPGIAPNNPIQYCQGEVSLPLTASGSSLHWFGPWAPNPANAPDKSTRDTSIIYPRTDFAGNWVYGVVQNVTCPSDTAYIIVTVKPKPAKPTVPPNAVEYCQFSPASPLSASGANIRWFSTPTGGVGTATPPTPNTLVSGTYFYYVSQTVNGCESDRSIITVNVKPKPAPPAVTSPLNLCQGDPVGPLTAIGQNLLWYTTASGGVGVPVAPIPNTGYEDSFKYWVSQTVNGCESDRALIQAYVNYKPNGVIVGSSQWVCQDADDTFYYYGNARPDAQYVWYSPYPQTHAVSGKDTRGPFIVHFDSAGTAVIRLQINNKGCISTLIAAPITVRHLPVVDYSLKRDVCKDELVNIALTATEPGISDYMFNFGNTTDTTMVYSAPPGGPFGIRYHTPGDYVVAVTATLDQCTSKPLEKRITVHDLPNAHISVADAHDLSQPVCASDTITLSVTPVGEGATYTWTPAAYFQSLRDTLNYIVRAVPNQSSEVKVHVKTAYGCEATDSIAIITKPCCGVFFPTAFDPTSTTVPKNRRFKPITIGFHQVNTFRVINRWGQVVYETHQEPHGESEGWDGTYNGVPQDMGVYYWYISYKCEGKTVEDHGEVTLMR